MPMLINYVKGDATNSLTQTTKLSSMYVTFEAGLLCIGQRDIKKVTTQHPLVRYDVSYERTAKVSTFAQEIKALEHIPRIGCGVARGTWDQIELLHIRTYYSEH